MFFKRFIKQLCFPLFVFFFSTKRYFIGFISKAIHAFCVNEITKLCIKKSAYIFINVVCNQGLKAFLERFKRWVSTTFLSYFITNKSLKKYSIRNDVVFMILKSKKVLKSIIQFFQSFFSENFP